MIEQEFRAGASTYLSVVGPDALGGAGRYLAARGLSGRVRIVSDDNVWPCHGAKLATALEGAGLEVAHCVLPAGEATKSLEWAGRVYDWLVEERTERGDVVVALGGGVIGDLAGFVAATFLRGLRLVHVPTSLAAQVDASIGGKTGVNHPKAKNLIGAFYQPQLVIADTLTLRTLPLRELGSGWAEVIKMGMVLDGKLFERLAAEADGLRVLEEPGTSEVVARCVELKAGVVEQDEREADWRMVLNYGHTVGHAIEAATGYSRYLHGEAVAIGMNAASFLAEGLGLLESLDRQRQTRLLASFGLPLGGADVEVQDLRGPLSLDKKTRAARPVWVLPRGIGQVEFRRDVPTALVDKALALATTGAEAFE